MRKTRFFFYTFTGAFVWNLFLTECGVLLGQQWENIGYVSKPLEILVIIALVGLVAWFIFKQVEKRTLERRTGAQR